MILQYTTKVYANQINSSFLGNEDQAYGQCQQVEILDIRGVEITPKCAAEIYALRVQKWRNFKVDKTFNVIMECLQNYPEVESFKTDYLRFQTIEYDEIKLESYIQGALLLASGRFLNEFLKFHICLSTCPSVHPSCNASGQNISSNHYNMTHKKDVTFVSV